MSLVSLPFEMDRDMLITKQEIYQERQNFNFLAFHALVAVCVCSFFSCWNPDCASNLCFLCFSQHLISALSHRIFVFIFPGYFC